MFDLHNLGWNSFQQLCLTITREILGQTVEAFLDSSDGGRDGAFAGSWRAQHNEDLTGQFVIQCKFTSTINGHLTTKQLVDEVEKARRLVAAGRCDSYVLMTNAGLTGRRSETITSLFKDAGVRHVAVLGATWIDQQIRENKRLRMLVPRLYGLGDLSQILDERAYAQARAVLESMREDLAKVVVTDAYRRAAEAISKHSFVLLVGEPAAGKTTIASLLAMAAVDQWNASILKLDDPDAMITHWNPDEPSQFFWLDDAFGVTQYEDNLVRRWNHILPQIRTMLRKGAKVVMTSRDYIYNRARNDLKEGAFPLLRESQVVIDVHDLSVEEKRQILYNHIRLGTQPQRFRTRVKPYLEGVAGHPQFIPETARRLADSMFTRDLVIDEVHLNLFVERRELFLQDVLEGLDVDSRSALGLIYIRGGRLDSPIDLQPAEEEVLDRLGSSIGRCLSALDALKGSLVEHKCIGAESGWHFKHPTIGDAFTTILARNPEHLGVLIQGVAPERLVEMITCGDVGREGAVIVPRALFPRVVAKLNEEPRSRRHKSRVLAQWWAERERLFFLAHRCSDEFLAFAAREIPGLMQRVAEPGLYLDAVAEVSLAERLYDLGLLPEELRERFVETVSEYALEGQDASALCNEGIRSLFKEDEFEQLERRIREELVPRLGGVRLDWEHEHGRGGDASEHAQPLLEMLDTLQMCFAGDSYVNAAVNEQRRRLLDWVDENTPEERSMVPRVLGDVDSQGMLSSTRSIFDDIDAVVETQTD